MADAADWMGGGQQSRTARPRVDLQIDRPHAARVYDVLLGGKTNYPADRAAAEQTLEALPAAAMTARHNRAFMHRVARHLAKSGIRQFLDIGTGIPTSPNLHEVVQSVAPTSRIVYVDNDPIVLTHSRALHTSRPEGRTAYFDGDLCDPDAITGNPELRKILDLSQPVAVSLVAVLHWLPRAKDPYAIVGKLLEALPVGSYLAMTHVTDDFDRAALDEVSENFRRSGSNVNARSKEEVARFFDGLELVDPGVVVVQRWRPEEMEAGVVDVVGDTDIPLYGGVARKV